MGQNSFNNRQTLLHLFLIPEIGPVTVIKIIKGVYKTRHPEFFNIELSDIISAPDNLDLFCIYNFSASDFIKKCELTEKISNNLVVYLKDKEYLLKERELIEKHKINVLTILDQEYPDILRQIHQPPIILYAKGEAFVPNAKRLAIVGSRRADSYAQDVVNTLVPVLVSNNWEIVSGGALGVDTMAHKATVKSKGKTIVVLGSGFLNFYPESNKELFENIIFNGGIIVSPFSLNTPPDKGTFPARNRIISGLSHGCVVVRAAQKSGALVTAHCALDQGRQVFSVPGSVHDDLSAGCHALIQEGAKLVHTPRDILEEFGEFYFTQNNFLQETKVSINNMGNNIGKKDNCDQIINILNTPATIDNICEQTGLTLEDVYKRLFDLEIEGKVHQDFSGLWEKV